jgi:hypothetical protein
MTARLHRDTHRTQRPAVPQRLTHRLGVDRRLIRRNLHVQIVRLAGIQDAWRGALPVNPEGV